MEPADELREHLGPAAEISLLAIDEFGESDRHRQELMIAHLILANANSVIKMDSLMRDIQRSELGQDVKDRLTQFIELRKNISLNSANLAFNMVDEPTPPQPPEVLSEYLDRGMSFTSKIITRGVDNAMRYLR